ncbi:metallophosphoesterase [Bacillus safensis]|uniref:metallophosphoesterase n=1 Tax=Bacillus safensis TaxID=561879 RepID=UPI000BA5A372|nr:metallophosphoesterase [Bacillus safensis]OYN66618.1 metallophosphoesterase [Bacillus safensis]
MKQLSRRQFLKGAAGASILGFLATSCGYGYARYIEPRMIDTVSLTIHDAQLPASFDQFKIAQFSDVHLSDTFPAKDLEAIVQKINAASPDLIVFTGDLVDFQASPEEHEKAKAYLNKLHAPFGKLAIYGNHDYGPFGVELYEKTMEACGLTLCKNEVFLLEKDHSHIQIAALDDLMMSVPDYDLIKREVSSNLFTLLLVHEPDAALELKTTPINLQLSGHTHGGQVQLPFYGPILTAPYGHTYVEGLYGSYQHRIYVNRGLGTTRLPLRFLAKPELTFFTFTSRV